MSVLLEKKIRVDNILTVNTVCAKAIEDEVRAKILQLLYKKRLNANLACIDLPEKFKKKVQNSNSEIIFTIKVGPHSFTIHGKGSEKLTLKHKNDIVLRKSAFVCSRTLAIKCDMASDDIPREIIKELQSQNAAGIMIIEVK